MPIYPRATDVAALPGYRLDIRFADGTSGFVDGTGGLQGNPLGVFAPLRDPAVFAEVHLLPEAGTIGWPGDVALCPDVLYALAHGIPLPGID